MSEPLTSVEIEDVLSSIRRLVSDDMRPAPRTGVAPAGDKLILTPALRVVSDGEPAVPEAFVPEAFVPEALVPETFVPEAPMAENVGIEQVVASLSAAVQRDDEWEHEADEALPQDTLSQDWSLPADDTAPQEVPGWAQEAVDDPEPAEPAMSGTVEPDPVWAAAAEARVIAELEGYDADAAPAAGGIFAADDPLSYDEQVLRDMVREIIREELQGGLGERITRNIRKLVRAEIARALATQGME